MLCSGHKEVLIFNHLMLVDANCDDSVTIPRCPNLVVDLKVSVALKKTFACLCAHFWHPLFQNLDPPLAPVRTLHRDMVKAVFKERGGGECVIAPPEPHMILLSFHPPPPPPPRQNFCIQSCLIHTTP